MRGKVKGIWSALERKPWNRLVQDVVAPLFKKQIKRVLANSPFYQKKIDISARASLDLEDLCHFVFTEKQELIDDEQKYPPFGSNVSMPVSKVVRINRTSGMSGKPLLLALTRQDSDNTSECGARCFWSCGLRPSDMVVHCLNYCMWAGGVTDHLSLERTGAAVIPYGVGNSSNLIQTILSVRPSAIHCTPSYLSKLEEILAQEFKMTPGQLGLKLGLFAGEGGLQNKYFRDSIEKTWGFRAMDANYGVSEALSMFGAECMARDGMHFMGQGVIHIEIKDINSDRIIPWEPGAQGELVITNICKECQPLIRYRSNDIIEVGGVGRCGCGRHSPRFKVIGRMEDMIVVKGINVFISSIAAAIGQHLDVLTGEFRVLIDKEDPLEHFVIKAEVRNEKVRQGLKQELEEFFKNTLYTRPVVEITAEGSLSRSEGKTKRIERIL